MDSGKEFPTDKTPIEKNGDTQPLSPLDAAVNLAHARRRESTPILDVKRNFTRIPFQNTDFYNVEGVVDPKLVRSVVLSRVTHNKTSIDAAVRELIHRGVIKEDQRLAVRKDIEAGIIQNMTEKYAQHKRTQLLRKKLAREHITKPLHEQDIDNERKTDVLSEPLPTITNGDDKLPVQDNSLKAKFKRLLSSFYSLVWDVRGTVDSNKILKVQTLEKVVKREIDPYHAAIELAEKGVIKKEEIANVHHDIKKAFAGARSQMLNQLLEARSKAKEKNKQDERE